MEGGGEPALSPARRIDGPSVCRMPSLARKEDCTRLVGVDHPSQTSVNRVGAFPFAHVNVRAEGDPPCLILMRRCLSDVSLVSLGLCGVQATG